MDTCQCTLGKLAKSGAYPCPHSDRALGHKESFPSPSLQYASIFLRKGETGSAFGFLVTSSVAGCIAMMRVVHSYTHIHRFQSFEEAKVRDSLDVCSLINFTISLVFLSC